MSDVVEMSFKVEADLHDRFLAVAAMRQKSPPHIIQELMELYVEASHVPNELTAQTLRDSIEGVGLHHASDMADLRRQLER